MSLMAVEVQPDGDLLGFDYLPDMLQRKRGNLLECTKGGVVNKMQKPICPLSVLKVRFFLLHVFQRDWRKHLNSDHWESNP